MRLDLVYSIRCFDVALLEKIPKDSDAFTTIQNFIFYCKLTDELIIAEYDSIETHFLFL